jgi:hypothetical protein
LLKDIASRIPPRPLYNALSGPTSACAYAYRIAAAGRPEGKHYSGNRVRPIRKSNPTFA